MAFRAWEKIVGMGVGLSVACPSSILGLFESSCPVNAGRGAASA